LAVGFSNRDIKRFKTVRIAPLLERRATKANPAKAGDAKPRGYRIR
jgi:hypothetical protein